MAWPFIPKWELLSSEWVRGCQGLSEIPLKMDLAGLMVRGNRSKPSGNINDAVYCDLQAYWNSKQLACPTFLQVSGNSWVHKRLAIYLLPFLVAWCCWKPIQSQAHHASSIRVFMSGAFVRWCPQYQPPAAVLVLQMAQQGQNSWLRLRRLFGSLCRFREFKRFEDDKKNPQRWGILIPASWQKYNIIEQNVIDYLYYIKSINMYRNYITYVYIYIYLYTCACMYHDHMCK